MGKTFVTFLFGTIFDDEEMDEKKLDLFSLITKEEEGLNNNFKEYARGKMVEAYLGSQ